MFLENLIIFPSIVNFSISSLAKRFFDQTLILMFMFLFSFKKTIFTSVVLLFGIGHHFFRLKLYQVNKNNLKSLSASTTDFKIEFKTPELIFLKIIPIFSLTLLIIKFITFVLDFFLKKTIFYKSDQIESLSVLSSFVFETKPALKIDFLFGVLFTFLSWTYYVKSAQSQNYYDRITIKILKNMITTKTLLGFYTFMYLLLVFKVFWNKYWTLINFIENVIIVVVMIVCFVKYQINGTFSTKKFLNYHKYLCLLKLLFIIAYFILWYLNSVIPQFKKTIENFPEIRVMKESFNSPLTLLFLLYLSHSWLNFLIKFHHTFVESPKQPIDKALFHKPYNLNFISYFAKNLIQIVDIGGLPIHLKSNLSLKFKFYKDLMKHNYFKKQFEYSMRSYLSEANLPFKFRFLDFARKIKLIFDIYKFDLMRLMMNFVMIYYFSVFFVELNVLSLFYFIAALSILIFTSFKSISHSVFIFGIVPSLMIILFIGFYSILRYFQYDISPNILKSMANVCGFELHSESIRIFLQKKINFIGIGIFYLILLSFINSKTDNQKDFSLIQFLKNKRLVILNTDEDFLFVFKRIFLVICLCVKYFVLSAILVEFLNFVNLLNSIALIFLIVYVLFQTKKTFSIFCEVSLFLFIFRFIHRYVKMIWGISDEYNFLFGYFYNDTFSFSNYTLEKILLEQDKLLLRNFLYICVLFVLKKAFEEFDDTKVDSKKTFKTKKLLFLYNLIVDLLEDSKHFLYSMKIFVLYFFTFRLSRTSEQNTLSMIEYLFTMTVLIFHLFLLKHPGKIQNYIFFGLFAVYTSFLSGTFCFEYESIFRGNYLKVESYALHEISVNLEFKKSFEYLLSSIIKTVISMICLKDIYVNLFIKSKENTNNSAFTKITKEKFYFSVLKFFSVFFKEIFLIFFIKDFFIPPNTIKLLYLCLYMSSFASQFTSLAKISKEFYLIELIRAKIYYFKECLLEPKFEITYKGFNLCHPIFEELDIIYYKLFIRKTYNSFYKKIDKVWILMFTLIMGYMSILFILKDKRANFDLGKFQLIRVLVNFWENKNAINSEYERFVYIFGITVLEIFFINVLKSEWTYENENMSKIVSKTLLNRYFKVFDQNRQLPIILGVEESSLGDFEANINELHSYDFSKSNFQLEKYKSSPEPNLIDNLKKNICYNDKCILIRNNRTKCSSLQIIIGSVLSVQRFALFPFLVGLMKAPFSSLTIFAGIITITSFFNISTDRFYRVVNICVFLLCFCEYTFFVIFENELFYKIYENKFIYDIFLNLKKSPFSGLKVSLQYIVLMKIFYQALIAVCSFAFIRIDKIPLDFWSKIKEKTIKGQDYYVINYKHWNFWIFELLHSLKKLFVLFSSDVFYILTLVSYYHVSGVLASIIFAVFLTVKVLNMFNWKCLFINRFSRNNEGYYFYTAILNVIVIYIFHFQLQTKATLFQTNNSYYFPAAFVFNLIILDCVDNYDFQFEKVKFSANFKLRLRLNLLSQVYKQNEREIIACAKDEMLNSYFKKKLDRVFDDPVKHREEMADIENLTHLSLFSKSRSYFLYLKEKLGLLRFSKISLMFWIQKKTVNEESLNANIFSLLNSYISKNACFIQKNYKIDYCKIVNGEFGEIEELIDHTENLKKTKFEEDHRDLVGIVKNKLEKAASTDTLMVHRRTTVRLNSSPLTPAIITNVVHSINRELLKKLTRNVLEEQFFETGKNQFSKNFFKFQLSNSEFLIIRNFDEIEQSFADLNSINRKFMAYFSQILRSFFNRLELAGSILLVILFCFNQGIFSSFYIGILLFGVIMENKVKNVKIWRIFYIIFQFNFLIIMALNSSFDLLSYHKIMQSLECKNLPPAFIGKTILFFYGKVNESYLLFVFAIVESIFLITNDNGNWDRNINEIETKSQAMYRLSFTENGFLNIFNHQNQIILSKINTLEFHLKAHLKSVLTEKNYTKEIVNLGKKKSEIYRMNKEKYLKFLQYLEKLNIVFKTDTNLTNAANYNSYLWRNFSYTHRKSSHNYHKLLFLSLFTFLIYFFVYYFKINSSEKSINEILKKNEIYAELGINISLILIAICVERCIYSSKKFFWIEPADNKTDMIKSHLRNLNVSSPDFRCYSKTLKDLFIKSIKKLILINRLKTKSGNNWFFDLKYNPLFFRFIFSVVFCIYLNVLVFVIVPLSSNKLTSGNNLDSVFCNSYYRTIEEKYESKFECNSLATNIYLQLLFLIGNFYLILSVIQIKIGFSSRFHFKLNKFENSWENIKFYVYKYTPYVRELKTIIDFLSTKSSLDVFQWFRIEDINTTLLSARMAHKKNVFNAQRLDKTKKRIMGISFLAFFFILLLGPLYLFSDYLFSSNLDHVFSANIVLYVNSRGASYSLYRNHGFQIEKMNKSLNIFQKIYKHESLKKFESESFQNIVFGSHYNSQNSITLETAKNIKSDFENSGVINFDLTLNLETVYRGSVRIVFEFELKGQGAETFLQLIGNKKCAQTSTSRINLGTSPKMLNLRQIDVKSTQKATENPYSNLENYFVLVSSCNPNTNWIVFDLSEEFNPRLEFVILNKNIRKSVTMLQSFTEEKISLKYIYIIIFTYIGLTLIRNALFSQAHLIWISEIPNSYKLEELIYLMRFARIKGNFVLEQQIFTKLIDLYRSPEEIKELTGSFLDLNRLKAIK